jgi:cytochrome c biogenesis protein CcdA
VILRFGVAIALLAMDGAPAAAEDPRTGGADALDYYWGEGCPACERHAAFLASLVERYPELEIRRYEVRRDATHRERLRRILEEREVAGAGIPVTVFGDQLWVGHSDQVMAEITAAVSRRLTPRRAPEHPPPEPGGITVPLLGEVDVGARSLLGATLLIAFADGFNPCSLWVLTVLLAMIVRTGSRRRVAAVGITFLSVTALVYGLFVLGVFTVLAYLEHLGWLYWLVALLALVFGVVNIKDYFAYKWGISFTIPDRFKPGIMRQSGKLRSTQRSLAATLALTALMALGVALVELPCTAGFPVVWSALLSAHGVAGAGFGALLGVYLLVYLAIELVILTVVLVTLRLGRFEEREGRILKLVGGMIMVALAGVLVIEPDIMGSLGGSLTVVGGAVAAAFVVMAVDRAARARAGRPTE